MGWGHCLDPFCVGHVVDELILPCPDISADWAAYKNIHEVPITPNAFAQTF
jgi:hypothetical protein